MSKNFFFKSLHYENYRGIKKLSIEQLRRVNIVGGLNGVGKTTFLDGIFTVLARNHPMLFSRPFLIRQSKLPYPNGFDYVFNDFDPTKIVKIHGEALSGSFSATLESSNNQGAQISSRNGFQQTNDFKNSSLDASRSIALRVSTNNNTLKDESVFSQPSEDDLGLNIKAFNVARTPAAAYSGNPASNPAEDAQRYSILFKERRTENLIKYLRLLYTDLKGLQLLQEGGLPVLYAEFSDGSMQQCVLLGGGFQMMLSISLMMMTIKNGIFLFDEIDNAIHHSLLKDFWELVAKLADDNNSQVFAVTHSRECIRFAVEGFVSAGRLSDLAYFRLEEGLMKTNCVSYDGEELVEALSSDWEMR